MSTVAKGLLTVGSLLVVAGPALTQPQQGVFRSGAPAARADYDAGARAGYNTGRFVGVNQAAIGAGYGGWGGYGIQSPYQGYLSGAADVINSQGQFMIDNQQARLMKEQVKGAQLQNRRASIDEWQYERNNLPTVEDERERFQQEQIRRSLNDPPVTEIWSAKALNDLYKDMQKLHNSGIQGPTVPLEPSVLARINVQTAAGQGNVGALKTEKLRWPQALQLLEPKSESRKLRQEVDMGMQTARSQAAGGDADAELLFQLQKDVEKLQFMVVAQVANIPFSQYIEAKRYLRDLLDALRALRNADAGAYVTGKYSARGRNVEELVENMTKQGLSFAPAVAGQESAYQSLYQSMVRYNSGSKAQLTTQRR